MYSTKRTGATLSRRQHWRLVNVCATDRPIEGQTMVQFESVYVYWMIWDDLRHRHASLQREIWSGFNLISCLILRVFLFFFAREQKETAPWLQKMKKKNSNARLQYCSEEVGRDEQLPHHPQQKHTHLLYTFISNNASKMRIFTLFE